MKTFNISVLIITPKLVMSRTKMAPKELNCPHCSQMVQVTSDGRCKVCKKPSEVTTIQLSNSNNAASNCRISGRLIHLKNKIASGYPASHRYETLNSISAITTTIGGVRSKKRAVLCGVSYKKQRYKLKGTINDVKSMRNLLMETFKFPKESFRVLTEEEQNPNFSPTRKNIQEALQWLVQDCQDGDSLVFYYSGHGLRQMDFNRDELDGFDETICPVDFKTEGMILDNDINSAIVRPLKHGVTLHAIVDACHSGTILDLIYVYDKKMEEWVDNSPPSEANKRTSGGLAICFSACEDHQLAADTSALSGNEMAGAMSYSLISALRENPDQTYGSLLDSMNKTIESANESGCFNGHLKKLFNNKIYQDPQLSSTEKFNIYSKKFKL